MPNKTPCPNCSGTGQMCVACMKDSRSCSCSSGERTLTYCRPCEGLGKIQVGQPVEAAK